MNKEALDVLKNRRSIRKYKAEQITAEELNAVLEAGTYGATGGNTQSPVIVAVQDPETVKLLDQLNAKAAGRDITPYYGAPTIILILASDKAMNPEIGLLDAAAVTTNMINAAYAVGLGSCWIHRTHQVFDSEEGKALLRKWGLSENLTGVASIALGYADCEHPEAKPRREDYIVRI